MISARPCRLPANRGEIEGIERRPSTLGPGGLAGSGWCRRGGERRLQKRARRSCWHLRIAISGPFLCRARRPLGIGQVSVWSWAEGVLYVVSRALPLQQPLARSPPPLARAFFVVRQGAGRTHNRQALPRCHEFRPRQHLSTGVWGAAAYARGCRRPAPSYARTSQRSAGRSRNRDRPLCKHEGHPHSGGERFTVSSSGAVTLRGEARLNPIFHKARAYRCEMCRHATGRGLKLRLRGGKVQCVSSHRLRVSTPRTGVWPN
jgi:hypothetical protein